MGQHKSYLHGVVEKLIAGKLKESIYPSLEQRFPGQSRVGDVVAFVVGGATFEESRDLQMLQQGNPAHRIFLGGSSVLNTSSFLDAVQLFLVGFSSCQGLFWGLGFLMLVFIFHHTVLNT